MTFVFYLAMSVILKYIEEHPKLTQRLIGITYEQLQDLWREAEIVHLKKKQRPTD